ncbi:pectinesterase-like [Impatiens glandulifera]|uniref:pectinesterase-like n=1 Tax=Impatiens glandulifera TaxID=253017 RepID=UPI001FB183CD|nr:pectinesterase-like [Impatiens glandulifera]
MNKLILVGISSLLVVAVAIGVVVVSVSKSSSSDDDNLSTTSKSVSTICTQTDHKQLCVASLGSVASNETATPIDFLLAAINYTISSFRDSAVSSEDLGKSVTDSYHKMAMEDCQELLQDAVSELQASFSAVGDSNLHTVQDREDELKNWLSAVISYQQSCLDDITQPELKSSMSNGFLNATQLTDNALAIVSAISKIFSAFNIPIFGKAKAEGEDASSSSRRLLEADGLPSWLPTIDRKLLAVNNNNIKPNAVVAKDGSGQYKSIGAALAAYPKNLNGKYIIYIKAGVYDEYITIPKDQKNIFMYGDGSRKTIVTGDKSNAKGVPTFKTASFSVVGDGFLCKSMGFTNTAGPEGHQAVALRVQSDMSAFYNVRMDGYQDTLYAQAKRQFYRNCVISGTVDFIFGDAAQIIQNSLLIVRKPMDNQQCIVTAQGRSNNKETTGIVIQNCRIVPEQKLEATRFKVPSYLGRPWKEYSRSVIMQSTLGDFIQPAGWMPWEGDFALNTCFFAEYQNRGPGSATNSRVKWKGVKVITNAQEAQQFTVGPFIQGNQWLPSTGVPFFLGLKLTRK